MMMMMMMKKKKKDLCSTFSLSLSLSDKIIDR